MMIVRFIKVHKNMHVQIFNKEDFYCESLVKVQCERLIKGLVAAKTGAELSFEEL